MEDVTDNLNLFHHFEKFPCVLVCYWSTFNTQIPPFRESFVSFCGGFRMRG